MNRESNFFAIIETVNKFFFKWVDTTIRMTFRWRCLLFMEGVGKLEPAGTQGDVSWITSNKPESGSMNT